MSTPHELIERAFQELRQKPGFVDRPDQHQLALLLSDLIGEGSRGAFEAPTGLGKSLAALIPAIAHAIVGQKRTVIATYTNVLAEQYWRHDLPLALSLFGDLADGVRSQLLMGRQKYACLTALDEHAPDEVDGVRAFAELGIESEFRQIVRKPSRTQTQIWQKIAAPPVCHGRLCPAYDDCFYFTARRKAESAEVVITNHSVVIQDALLADASGTGESLLGKFDFLIVDEAHDFPQAALNGLEFELSTNRLNMLLAVTARIESLVLSLAQKVGDGVDWQKRCAAFRDSLERAQRDLVAYSLELGRPGILTASPEELLIHPQVNAARTDDTNKGAQELAASISDACEDFVKGTQAKIAQWQETEPERARQVRDSLRSYGGYLREYGIHCFDLFEPRGVAVSYVSRNGAEAILRQDIIGLADPLTELIWNRTPYACLSATLALDGNFDFFKRSTGALPDFEEVLPSPFDYSTQAAIYLPLPQSIPDPTVARREGTEELYWRKMAAELSKIIRAVGGRTLALFHSRKEMEGVLSFMDLPPELPIYTQLRYGTGSVGEKFVNNVHSSLFALRSFWTGFDAPGETLSCVALVRVPFEVPIEPPQIARLAYLQQQGLDAFGCHTLPLAKMLMRQGAGRLIRRAEDKGIIAILDPRIQTKRYGEEILANLPHEARMFREIEEAVAFLALDTTVPC